MNTTKLMDKPVLAILLGDAAGVGPVIVPAVPGWCKVIGGIGDRACLLSRSGFGQRFGANFVPHPVQRRLEAAIGLGLLKRRDGPLVDQIP